MFRKRRAEGPSSDDFSALSAVPWIITQWFGKDPAAFIRRELTGLLRERMPDSSLEWMKIMATPTPLADGHLDHANPASTDVIMTRVALYVPLTAATVSPAGGREFLQGALTIAVGNLNQPGNRVKRSWLDVDDYDLNRLAAVDQAVLKKRMMSVGEWLPSDYPPGSPENAGR